MHLFLLVLITASLNLSGSQAKNDAQACMKILVFQMKMDAHNKTIGPMLQPFARQEEMKNVNARFKQVRENFSRDVLNKMWRAYERKDFSDAWAYITPEMKKVLFNYYSDSARSMDQAKLRAIKEKPDFAQQKEYALIEMMIAVSHQTSQMLELATHQAIPQAETRFSCVIL